MSKIKRTPHRLTAKYMIENAKHRGLEMTHALSEFIDNSIDADANNITITKERQSNGLYTLTIQDDGIGISKDKIKGYFSDLGSHRAYSKKTTSAFGVGSKEAMSMLTNEGIVKIWSVQDGIESYLDISFKLKDYGLSEVITSDTSKPNGTKISISNVEMTDKDHHNLIRWVSFIYYPAYQQNSNLKITFVVKLKTKEEIIPVQFIDVMYRDLVNYENDAVELHRDVEYPIGNESIKVKVFIFKTEEFVKKELFSTFDIGQKGRGSFGFERAGIYWRLGSRYSNLGKGNFITMTNQHTLNNTRIEIDISGTKLMKLFKVNQNKSKITIPRDVKNNPELETFFEELRILVRNIVSNVKFGKRNLTEDEKTDIESLNDFANNCGDFTGLGQHLEENKKKLPQGEPMEREETEETGIKRNRKKGYKQNRDAYRIEYKSTSPWAPFMELPKIYSNKYIYTINTAHPYYDVFNQLNIDSKNHIVMLMMNMLSTLLHIETDENDTDFTRKFIEKSDSILKNWVEALSFKGNMCDIDLDLD
jgi:hypothetical protein